MRLHKENSHFWHRLITDYIGINRPHVCVIGRPNMKLVDEITQKENERIESQRKRLGKNGLADCGRQLAKAIDTNTVSIVYLTTNTHNYSE
jgi:Zn-dependent M16 (insulinase) family peptidase